MANGKTYGIDFPFRSSQYGQYLSLSQTADDEIRNNLIHLLLTRKGTRYYLPDFGTRLYEYIFEPMDSPTFDGIESEIRESCERYIPNLKINKITITAASSEEEDIVVTTEGNATNRSYRMPGLNNLEYTAKVRIDYIITDNVFNSKDFVIINI
jgi:phage baseplate assembly protein W